MKTAWRILWGGGLAIVVAAIFGSATQLEAALIPFSFEGETSDPSVTPVVGHLLYNDLDSTISDLMFSIGGESLVNYARDTVYLSPLLVSLPGETRLFLNEEWVFASRRLFFAGPDLDNKQVFGDINSDILVQAGSGKWFTPVPEPSTIYSGLLILIPIGWSTFQKFRQLKR